jgi:Mn-containing catalase
MLLNGINGELKDAAERSSLMNIMKGSERDAMIHEAATSPQFLVLSGGGPSVDDSVGHPWSGRYVNANGDLTVDLRSNIAAESRAKIVYEYLLQFTDDPMVKETLDFLMTREISHFQMFSAALEEITPNFPPGVLQGNPRFTHVYFNMSNGREVRGPWNEGEGPWVEGEWSYVNDPVQQVRQTQGLTKQPITGSPLTDKDVKQQNRELSKERSSEVKSASPEGAIQWSEYEPAGGAGGR